MMNALRKDKKDEEDGFGAFYVRPDRSTVLQEARTFNETPINPRKCIRILTKILIVIGQGDKLGKMEATQTFFAITKLFQSNDTNLRRMVYLVIKELSPLAEDVIIVTSSLTKDMTGPEVAFRGPAIRTLCTITDATMVQSIERYLKQSIVDKNPAIACAVLTAAFKLMKHCPDVIKRWVNECQEAANSSKTMVQYHALGLLYMIRRKDRLAVTKMIQKFIRSGLRSPYACCMMLRIVSKHIDEEGLSSSDSLFEFMESSLRHKSEMVMYEAARSIVNLRGTTAREIAPAVSVLQLLCSSSKPALRYAAVRTLNNVANCHPAAVTACNLDLEQLIGDSNRSIATLAITTLLKTGNESSVERLLKHVCPFMSEISDEFKIVVLESIRALATKYPKKYNALLNFLSGLLRDSSGYIFKKAVVSVMETIIKNIPEAKNLGLLQLCEFIEDCEHVKLTQRILHLLGKEGPFLKSPRQFTRYIYNRVMLESAPVKCTATTALARFAAQNSEMLPSILVLLQRIMLDEDDEVRDRAAFYHYILSSNDPTLKKDYLLAEDIYLSPAGLERALLNYTQDSHAAESKGFSLLDVPVVGSKGPMTSVSSDLLTNMIHEKGTLKPTDRFERLVSGTGDKVTLANTTSQSARSIEHLKVLPQFTELGPLFKSSEPVELSEEDTEYVVTCIKHIFAKHLVLQYDCTNTMSDQRLENVFVEVEPEDTAFEILHTVPCSLLNYNNAGTMYVLVRLPEDAESQSTVFSNTLKFTLKDVDSDPSDPGLPDEYQLEDVSLNISDHIQRVLRENFESAWQELPPESEVEETYVLTKHKTITDTVKQVVEHLGLQPCDRTDRLQQEKSSHQLLLSGIFRGGYSVLARCKLAVMVSALNKQITSGQGISLQLIVRSSNAQISRIVADAIE